MTQGSEYGKKVVLRPKNCNSLKHFGALFRHELIWNLRCFVHFLLHLLILSKRNLKLTHFCASFCFSCKYIPPPCSTSHFAEKFYLLLLGREMSIICITIHKEKTGVKVFVWISSSGKLQILVSFLIRLMILAYHFKTI